jgi:hypothetical protein
MRALTFRTADWMRRAARRALFDAARACDRLAGRLETQPLLPAEEKALLARNGELAGRYAGRRAFVIGNGPSLAKQDLGKLAGELFFVSNGFWRHPILEKLQPVSLALCDPAYFDGAAKWDAEFAGIRAGVRAGLFLVPRIARPMLRQRELLPEARTYYCEFYGNMARLPHFTFDLAQPLPNCQTVTLFSIMIALHMGCNPIYLLGMDHDFLVTPTQATHFYQDDLEPASDDCYEEWPYDRLLEAVLNMWKGYRHLKAVAENQGRQILNASEGGYLDVFKRVHFESLFPSPSQTGPRPVSPANGKI